MNSKSELTPCRWALMKISLTTVVEDATDRLLKRLRAQALNELRSAFRRLMRKILTLTSNQSKFQLKKIKYDVTKK